MFEESKLSMKNFLSNGTIYKPSEFEKLVRDGQLTDEDGEAIILLNEEPLNYHVYIDRRLVTQGDGSVLTYAGFKKEYNMDEISVLFRPREQQVRVTRDNLRELFANA